MEYVQKEHHWKRAPSISAGIEKGLNTRLEKQMETGPTHERNLNDTLYLLPRYILFLKTCEFTH